MLDPFEPENKQKTKKKQRNRRKYPDSSELSRLEGGEGLRGHDYVSCL